MKRETETLKPGLKVGQVMRMAEVKGFKELEAYLMEAFKYFCQHDGRGLPYEAALAVWENMPTAMTEKNGKYYIVLPVGMPVEEKEQAKWAKECE